MGVWRATLAGLSATLVGIGLARFAYTPLIPALIAAGWMSPGEAAYVGAANLIGYLAGALIAPRLAARAPVPVILRAMMLLAAASFFACAFPLSFWWYALWRGAAWSAASSSSASASVSSRRARSCRSCCAAASSRPGPCWARWRWR
jgi:MFS family permease